MGTLSNCRDILPILLALATKFLEYQKTMKRACKTTKRKDNSDKQPATIMDKKPKWKNQLNRLIHLSSIVVILVTLQSFVLQTAGAAGWTSTNSMNVARNRHTATLLLNGKVLVAGGRDSLNNDLASAELYDPVAGTWTNTGSLKTARSWQTATLLPSGLVLCAAGGNSGLLSSSESYSQATGTWTNTGNLNTARYWHTATLLTNGTVLVAGGSQNDDAAFSSCEIYTPTKGIWTNTGSLNTGRQWHTATLLTNGQVLVAGGYTGNNPDGTSLSSAELYNPATGTWTNTGSLNIARYYHQAVLLPNGKVLVAGGIGNSGFPSSEEIYDPVSKTWALTGGLATGRAVHTATLLPNGTVLVAGGTQDGSTALSSSEVYTPAAGTWASTGSLNTARFYHTTATLPNGRVLVAGGGQGSQDEVVSFTNAELYSTISAANSPPRLAISWAKSSGSYQIAFTNTIGSIFSILSTTNLALSRSNWTMLGVAIELPPGQFQFNDPQVTNNFKRFYFVSSQ
jgi:N-acetylneuraminic acid mutarotase